MDTQHDNLMKAIQTLRPGAEFSLAGDTYAGLNWLDQVQTKPTEQEVQAEVSNVQAQAPMNELRRQRDALLNQCDWWAVTDRNLTSEQEAYRQALRNIPANNPNVAFDAYGNLINVTWPVKP